MTMLNGNHLVMSSHTASVIASWRLVWCPVSSIGKYLFFLIMRNYFSYSSSPTLLLAEPESVSEFQSFRSIFLCTYTTNNTQT